MARFRCGPASGWLMKCQEGLGDPGKHQMLYETGWGGGSGLKAHARAHRGTQNLHLGTSYSDQCTS